MILILSTGFSISTLPFTNSKCAGGAFGCNYFRNFRNQHARTSSHVQFSVRLKDPFSAFTMKTTTDRTALTHKAGEARDSMKSGTNGFATLMRGKSVTCRRRCLSSSQGL
jgi:hypothetical protein